MSRLIGKWIRNGYESFEKWRNYSNSQRRADGYRKRIAESKAYPFVGDKVIKRAKEDSDARFGNQEHWHWLALYAELREEYIEGWLPADVYTYRLIPFLNPRRLSYVSTYKSIDYRIFGSFASEPVVVVVNGSFYSSNGDRLTPLQFSDTMEKYNSEIVVKKDAAPSGKGIRFMNSKEIEPGDFDPAKSYLVQPLFRQHRALAEVYPQSVNTIRISTYLDRHGRASVKHKLLRVGHSGNRIVNWGDQDIDLYIDHSGKVVMDALDGIGRIRENYHPDNGYPFLELKVPSMQQAIEACKKAHNKFPYIRFIAWDLYIDEEGMPRMIEWNAVNPSFWVHEARIGPLWSEEEIKEVME